MNPRLVILAVALSSIFTACLSANNAIQSLGKVVDEPAFVWWGFSTENGIYLGVADENRTLFLKYSPQGIEELLSVSGFSQREAAVWTGNEVLIFGGAVVGSKYTPTDKILGFDPDSRTLKVLNVSLPYPTTDIAAVWSGKVAYLFMKGENSEPEIYAFNPENRTISKINVTFPEDFEHPGGCAHSAVWYAGKAYLFYRDRVACFDPRNETFKWLAELSSSSKAYVRAAVMTNDGIYLIGGSCGISKPTNEIIKFDPETGESCRMMAKLPEPRGQSVAVWDGSYIYIFGGYTKEGYASEVLRYDYKNDRCSDLS